MSIKRETTGGTMENITPTVSTTASTSARQGTTMQQQYKPVSHRQGGFTLIELMIVVAIIGILAAVAIPQYQNYTARAKMSEVITLMGADKTALSEYFMTEGGFPADTTVAAAAGIVDEERGKYIDNVTYSNTGSGTAPAATLTYKLSDINSDVDGSSGVELKASQNPSTGVLEWQCGPASGGDSETSIAEYLPSSCRSDFSADTDTTS